MNRRMNSPGFGTLEVVVALSLFAIVLVGVVGLMIVSITAGAMAEASSIGSNLARQRLDQVADNARRGATGSYPSTQTVGGRIYTFTVTSTDLADNIVNIEVKVQYPGPGTKPLVTYSRTLQTLVRKPGG